MAAERHHTRIKINRERVSLAIALFVGLALFCAGFLLRENSIGSAHDDFYNFHWPTIERFSSMAWSTAVTDTVGAANNPLPYMIASLFPLHSDQKLYHVMTFVVGLSTWPILSWAYYRRYSNYRVDWLWASFGASALLISPTFRSSAFWGTTDYLPLVFCAGTSLLLSRFQDSEGKARAMSPFALIALVAVSACAFYTRQFYAFLPILAAWIVLTRTETSPLLVLSAFFIAALPEVFLIYLWKGITPPSTRYEFHPALINVLRTGAVVGLLSTPIIVGCIRRSLSDVLPDWWGARSTALAFVGLLVFVMALGATKWPETGGGIIFKAGLMMGALGTPFILIVSYFGLVAAILFSTSSATNALLTAVYLVPFFVAAFTYQHYLEPSLTISLFLFADARIAAVVFNKRVLVCNFAFSALLLIIGIGYYNFFHLSR